METTSVLFRAILVCAFSLPSLLFSQDFVYKPKNPSFGGDTFNYNWLLNSANAQDLTEDETATARADRNALDDFTASLNRQLLSQISRELIGNQFGEGGLSEGSYLIGDFQIEVIPDLEGLNITILDTTNGGQTQIIVPYY